MRSVIIKYSNTETGIDGKFEMKDLDAEDFRQLVTMLRELNEAWVQGTEDTENVVN